LPTADYGGRFPSSSSLKEVRGLNKTQAEELLDLLEASGFQVHEIAHVSQEGFTVRYQ